MKIKYALAASTLALGLALAGAASAQNYGRLITFGDSLSDNGNLYLATAGGSPASPPYYQGRFSNGPVWVELLGYNQTRYTGPTGGSFNGAFGGSRTDNVASPGPGIQTQISNYQSAGGTFTSTDLVTVWGGANDIFQNMAAAGASANPTGTIGATATTAAGNIGARVNTIATAGAGTILVPNLPNLGTTPQFGGTAAQVLATHATTVFNATLYAQLQAQAAAHPNTNIILMDVNRGFAVLQSAPGRFGFTNATQACLLTACSTPDTYAFWDGVHPTAAGHRLVASMAMDYIYYADYGAHSAVQAEIAGRERENAMDTATERLGHGSFEGREGGIFVGGSYSTSTLDARDVIQGGDQTTSGLVIGAEQNVGDSMRAGVMFSARGGDVDLDLVDFNAEGVSLDAYFGWRQGQMFINAAGGVSIDQYNDIERQTATPGVVALSNTQGQTLGVRVEGGWVMPMGSSWEVVPRLGVAWTATDVDGYAEENDFGAQHQFDARSVEMLSAEAVLRAEGDVQGFGVWGEVGYRDALSYSGDPVSVRLAGNTALPLEVAAEDPNGGQLMLGAGIRGSFGPADISVGYRGRQGESYDSHTAMAQVTMRF